MERRVRTKMVEVSEECYVAYDDTEFKTEEQCLRYEQSYRQEEIRNKRLQIVVKPSVNEVLERLVKQKKIKSKNDLVNFLLEQFIEQNKE